MQPYKRTPIFDQDTLPAGLRCDHRTKDGVWGVIRVLSGRLRLHIPGRTEAIELSPGQPGFIQPAQTHWVEPVGPMTMQVEFYESDPGLIKHTVDTPDA